MSWLDVAVFMAAPFAMSLALVGIHCYLGLHVLARGVVFVDLALAQVAAMGSIVALMLGFEHHHPVSYVCSLVFTLVVAGFLALTGRAPKSLSQEALIGLIYAFSSAMLILLIDRTSHGAEHLKESMVGQLLWVTWTDVLVVALIYSAVGILHYVFRHQLIQASFFGKRSPKWDFVFYSLFGVVITSSVHAAGVLIVFSFLIVPALVSSLFFSSLKSRLLFGWLVGFGLCAAALFGSYAFDLPSGPTIVAAYTGVPLLLVLALSFAGKKTQVQR